MEFTFDTTGLGDITTVAFEDIYLGDARIAGHRDIEDTYQTVVFHPEADEETPDGTDKTPSGGSGSDAEESDGFDLPKYVDEIIKTGQAPFFGVLALLGLSLIGGGGYLFFRKRRG